MLTIASTAPTTEDHVKPPLGTEQRPSRLPRLDWECVGPVAAAMVVVELLVASRYGLHRDELYFILCGRHLAWAYVDQPPLVPAVARVATALFGTSPLALRALPAVSSGGAVVLTALIARGPGAGRRGQLLGAAATASCPEMLATFHLLSPTAFDAVAWSGVIYLAVRLCRTGDLRLWLAIGAAGGVGLMAKLNMGFLLVALAGGMVVGGRARLLTNRWALAGAGVALALFSPDLLWNASHDWAQLSMLHSLHSENSTLGASLIFLPAQAVVAGLAQLPIWIAGLRRLWHHQTARPLAMACAGLLAGYTASGAKPYYTEGIYFLLFAGGGLAVEEMCGRRATRRPLSTRLVALGVASAAAVVLALPVLPSSTLPVGSWEGSVNKDLSATVGWPGLARQIASVARSLPASQRQRLAIFTGDYGAAGAIDLYGAKLGLPAAISGHNNLWWWGPGSAPDGSTTIAVNVSRSTMLGLFAHVRSAGSVETPHGVWTEERGDPIWICTGQKVTWAAAWQELKHYD